MIDAPYVLHIRMYNGETIDLPCETYEIAPPTVDENGIETPIRLDYTPVEGWQQTLAYLHFPAVAAIVVKRSDAVIAAEQNADD